MRFFCFILLLLLEAIFLSSSVPVVSASFYVPPIEENKVGSKREFLGSIIKVTPEDKKVQDQGNAAPHLHQKQGESWCGGPSKFPIGKPVDLTITTPTGDRQVVLYIPSSYQHRKLASGKHKPVALQVLFHGLRDECHNFLNATGFTRYADKDGYILVSACGSHGWLGAGWNAGTCCGFYHDSPDDVAFARQIVQTIADGACIDPAKVFATGFSNGGMLSEVLACVAPDVFRAVASVSGVVEMRPGKSKGLEICTESLRNHTSRANVLMLHGDKDIFVPWSGFSSMGFPDIPSNVLGWVQRSGCNENVSHSTFNVSGFANIIYDACTSDKTRGLEDKASSAALSDVIFSKKSEDRLASAAPLIKLLPLRGLNEKSQGLVRLNNKEKVYQKKAFFQHLLPLPSNSSYRVKSETETEAGFQKAPLIVEFVREHEHGHHWYEEKNFSTTDYIYRFGLRVFGTY